jgi:hypothetical protein
MDVSTEFLFGKPIGGLPDHEDLFGKPLAKVLMMSNIIMRADYVVAFDQVMRNSYCLMGQSF